MKKFIILAFCINIAFGLALPKNSKYDNRINHINYNGENVTLIKLAVGYVTMLEFANDERSINIVTGFSDGWEILAKENFVFLKPKSYAVKQNEQTLTDENGKKIKLDSFIHPTSEIEKWKTNLIITTNKRIYSFDLVLVDNNESFNYQISFRYPQEEILKREEERKKIELAQLKADEKSKKVAEKNKIENELNRVNVPRNYDFVMHINKNSENIAPNFAYDDGVFTYIGFDNTKTMPSVFLFDETNGETMANTHIEKHGNYEVLVIHQTAQNIFLRSGDKLVGVKNNGYAKNPLEKTFTTKSKNVIRKVKDERK